MSDDYKSPYEILKAAKVLHSEISGTNSKAINGWINRYEGSKGGRWAKLNQKDCSEATIALIGAILNGAIGPDHEVW